MTFKLKILMYKLPIPQNKAKNIIKTNCNLVYFNSFISAFG